MSEKYYTVMSEPTSVLPVQVVDVCRSRLEISDCYSVTEDGLWVLTEEGPVQTAASHHKIVVHMEEFDLHLASLI